MFGASIDEAPPAKEITEIAGDMCKVRSVENAESCTYPRGQQITVIHIDGEVTGIALLIGHSSDGGAVIVGVRVAAVVEVTQQVLSMTRVFRK